MAPRITRIAAVHTSAERGKTVGSVLEFVKRSHSTDAQSGIVFDKATSKAFALKCSLVDNHDKAFASMSFEIGPAKAIRVRHMPVV